MHWPSVTTLFDRSSATVSLANASQPPCSRCDLMLRATTVNRKDNRPSQASDPLLFLLSGGQIEFVMICVPIPAAASAAPEFSRRWMTHEKKKAASLGRVRCMSPPPSAPSRSRCSGIAIVKKDCPRSVSHF